MKNFISFFKVFVKKPKEVSAWFPTSRKVAEKVANLVPKTSTNIIEYGPGPGTVARAILSRVGIHAKFTAIEILPDFVKELRKIKDSRLEIIDGDVIKISQDFKKESADVVLSSIPLSHVPRAEREKLIETSYKVLKPGGRLIIYYQNGKMILSLLEKFFDDVEWSFTLQNFTPYFIFVAKK